MMADLQEAKKNFKGFLFHEGKRHFKVVDPAVDLKGMAEAEIWGSDYGFQRNSFCFVHTKRNETKKNINIIKSCCIV
jgi:hypothetical protein